MVHICIQSGAVPSMFLQLAIGIVVGSLGFWADLEGAPYFSRTWTTLPKIETLALPFTFQLPCCNVTHISSSNSILLTVH